MKKNNYVLIDPEKKHSNKGRRSMRWDEEGDEARVWGKEGDAIKERDGCTQTTKRKEKLGLI